MVNDSANVTSAGRSFQICGPTTGKARLAIVDSLTDGTTIIDTDMLAAGLCDVELMFMTLGILEREQEQSVVYGSIDFGKTIVSHDKYKELVNIQQLLLSQSSVTTVIVDFYSRKRCLLRICLLFTDMYLVVSFKLFLFKWCKRQAGQCPNSYVDATQDAATLWLKINQG